MEKQIIQNASIFNHKSVPATPKDRQNIIDLRDTLIAHRNQAAGLAANMIGIDQQIIAFFIGEVPVVMVNPKIISASGQYQTEEGCLSLKGLHQTDRYQHIKVKYQDINFKQHTAEFDGFIAQVIQHEVDHCNGIKI